MLLTNILIIFSVTNAIQTSTRGIKKFHAAHLHTQAGEERMRGEREWNGNKEKGRKNLKHASPVAKMRRFCRAKRDEVEDAMDRGALDKRSDTGLIATFTLTAHQSRLTTSCTSIPHMRDPEKRKSIDSGIRRELYQPECRTRRTALGK